MPTRRFGYGIRLAYPSIVTTKAKTASTTLVDFLSVAHQLGVYFMPVSPQNSLGALGRGISGLVTQSIADVTTNFAFKQFVGSRSDEESFMDTMYSSIITEVRVMQHEPIKQNSHIVDLVGVCWDVDLASKRVWPVVVTSKADYGDLEDFLYENQNLTSNMKFQLCAYIAEAVELLHSCGIAHGDLKLENLLVQRRVDGSLNVQVIDFGASAVGHQRRQPVISAPWNSPESEREPELSSSAMMLSDLYSFGLVCAQILFPRKQLSHAGLLFMPQGETTDAWTQTLNNVRVYKQNDSLSSKFTALLDQSELPAAQKRLLKQLVSQLVRRDPNSRSINWHETRDLFIQGGCSHGAQSSGEPESPGPIRNCMEKEACNHIQLDILSQLGEYDDCDYLLRISVTEDLVSKASSITCVPCLKSVDFQLALAHRIGFGIRRNLDQSDHWLKRSGFEREDMEQALLSLKANYQHTGKLADQVKNAIGLGAIVATYQPERYQIEGRIFEAVTMLSAEVDDRECEVGENHISSANLRSQLALVHSVEGRLHEAEKLQHEAMKSRMRTLGYEHPASITSAANLARIMRQQGKLREAQRLQVKCLEVLERDLGPKHPDTLTLRTNLADTLSTQRFHKEAEALYMKAFESRKEILTPAHPMTIRTSMALFLCLDCQGKHEEVDRLIMEIESSAPNLARDDWLAHNLFQMNIANVHREQGRLAQAEKIAMKVVESCEKGLTESDMMTHDAHLTLVAIYEDLGRLEAASIVARKSLEAARTLGERNPAFLDSKFYWARNLKKRGLFPASISEFKELVALYKGPEVPNPDRLISCTQELSEGYVATGQKQEAEEMLAQLLMSYRTDFGNQHPLTMAAILALAEFYLVQYLYRRAEPLSKEIYDWAVQRRELDGLAILACGHLALVYREIGRIADGEKMSINKISWGEECYGQNHFGTKMAVISLVDVYIAAGKLDEAENLYLSKLASKLNGPFQEKLKEAVNATLGHLRQAQGKSGEAQTLYQEAIRFHKLHASEDDEEALRLAGLLLGAKQYDELTDELEQVALDLIRAKEKRFGENHESTLMTIGDLAYIYTLNDRLRDAGKLFSRLERLVDEKTIQSKQNFSRICLIRAEFFFKTRRINRAREEEEKCLRIRQETLGDEHKLTLVAMGSLSSTLNSLERYEEAEAYMRHVVEVRVRKLRPDEMPTLRSKKDLAGILYNRNRLEESEALYAEVVTKAINIFGDCAFTREQIQQLSIVRTRMMGLG